MDGISLLGRVFNRLHVSHLRAVRQVVWINSGLIALLIIVTLLDDYATPLERHSYLLLHNFLETTSVVIAMMVFSVGWNAHRRGMPGHHLLLGCAFFGVGLFDFSHMLSYEGMPQYVTSSGPEKGIDFWLAARTLASVALLVVAIAPHLRIRSAKYRHALFLMVLAFTLFFHWIFLYRDEWTPATFKAGEGLTFFKILFEYHLIALNVLTAGILWHHMSRPMSFNIAALFGTVCTMGIAEICFTLYSNTNDYYNVLGHVYKCIAYFFLYRGIFIETIEYPFARLRSSQAQLQATLDAVPDLMFELDFEGRYLEYHSANDELLAAPPEQFMGKKVHDILPPSAAAVCMEALSEAHEQGTSHGKQFALLLPSGLRWFELSVSCKAQAGEPCARFVVLSRDVTERKATSARLLKLSHAVEQSPQSIVITDLNGIIEYANPAFLNVTGYRLDEVLGQNSRFLKSGKTPQHVHADMWVHLSQGESWKGEFINRKKDGTEYVELALISPVRQADGSISSYIAIKEDITEKKKSEERIQKLAHFDPLTDLPNRVFLNDRVEHSISFVQRSHLPMAVMFLDLDHFKIINDTLGHRVGDEVLVYAAHQFKAVIRDEDTVARLGGDEFVFIFPGINANSAAQVAQKLLQAVSQIYQAGTQELVITASIGIAMYPDDGADFETLSRKADSAMYRVKHDGRNYFSFFTAEMQTDSLRALQLSNGLRHALQRGQLFLHFQPQMHIDGNRVIGVEALLRWQHPEWGMISPAEFIPIAEETGMIVPIGEWVLRTAVTQMRDWVALGLPPIIMAVNLSALQFRNSTLPALVASILREAQLPAEYLELELTEGVAMYDPLSAIAMMNELHSCGVHIAIDDFGTGYSSLNYLKKFKISKLKIDQTFVRDITLDQEDRTIVATIINMSTSLGFRTIAEGVETTEQLAFLKESGCDEVQGYLFSKPLPPAQFEAFYRSKLHLARNSDAIAS